MGSSTTRMILAVALTVVILLVWSKFFSPPPPPPPQEQDEAAETVPAEKKQVEAAEAVDKKAEVGPTTRPASETAKTGRRAADVEGQHTTLETDRASVTFTSRGAALRHFILKNPRYKEIRGGELQQVDLVKTVKQAGLWPLTTTFPSSELELPVDAEFKLVQKAEREVRYEWSTSQIYASKHFVLDPERPIMWMTLTVQNKASKELSGRLEVNLFNRQDPTQGKAGFTNPYPKIATVLCYVNGEINRRSQSAIEGTESGCSPAGCGMGSGPVSQTGEVLWVGSDDRYFLTAVVPKDEVSQRRCELKTLDAVGEGGAKESLVQASMLYPEAKIKPGETLQRKFAVFVGAKDLESLDTVTGAQGAEAHLDEAIEFGWLTVLCRPMLWLMKTFYSWFGNWGLAIILLTVVVKLLTLYWTQKSMRSMREMQRLKPKMDALREKYANDKERLNQEIMSLYKLHKVNPLGGCLPIVIQMPIWFALYRTLGNAVELYRSGFALWITDLTAPDPYYVLPVAMGLAMYGQQAISPQPLEGPQAKMMKYFMPGMFTVFMLWLPSGLTLYIFVNTVLTMLHQWYMNRTDPGRAEDVKPPAGSGSAQSTAGQKRQTGAGAGGGSKGRASKSKSKRRNRPH